MATLQCSAVVEARRAAGDNSSACAPVLDRTSTSPDSSANRWDCCDLGLCSTVGLFLLMLGFG